ncbi:Gfo/Idh/MocA family oxidoreductase [Pseudomonas sp. IC_126]|uniref:Gfo/Idh/MocA family protein n=1 Tax=Pseudomonas sp. IC_126 TaxID=2547400 RepID=UPI00103F9332|nr:Gfo/Idh/MocA family oxidoreductase [Pseudomonas sp. IC_126]TCD24311.1 Gfo/Idh/MocA family oxidoreductase [Pseudomonas sp. IC_126]
MDSTGRSKVRVGMVGGGEGAFIGQVHRQAMRLDGHIELVCGAFSRDPENNRRSGAALHLDPQRCYDAWETLLAAEQERPADQRMELLAIVTPNHLHAPIAEAALRAGFHVFSEKPAALSLADMQVLAEAQADSGRLYGLAHTYQGYPMVWQARHMVQAGALGRLRKIFVEYPQGWLSQDQAGQGNKQAAWRGEPAQAGPSGCMGDIGIHAFNLAEFVSGQRIERLCADLGVHVVGRQLDDDGAVLFQTDGGASGVLIASQVCTGEENALTLRLYGERGGLEWRQEEPNSLVHRPLGEALRVLRAGVDQRWLCEDALRRLRLPAGHPEGYLEAMANLYTDFATSIRSGRALEVPGVDAGLRGMAFIETVIASHHSDAKWTPFAATKR